MAFENCPRRDSRECPFAVTINNILRCGIATAAEDPGGESIVADMKKCPLNKSKKRKRK